MCMYNDKTANALWINNQDGTFTEPAGRPGATGLDGTSRAGMSVAFCDLDGDGDFEIHVSNIEGEADGCSKNKVADFWIIASGKVLLVHEGTPDGPAGSGHQCEGKRSWWSCGKVLGAQPSPRGRPIR